MDRHLVNVLLLDADLVFGSAFCPVHFGVLSPNCANRTTPVYEECSIFSLSQNSNRLAAGIDLQIWIGVFNTCCIMFEA